jgi:MFS family permease
MHLKKIKDIKIPSSIWYIGLASLLLNISTAMIFGISALYMKSLGVATGWIVWVEGVVEACAYIIKLLSGVFSDYLMKRKLIMVCGFGLAAFARPLLATSSSFISALLARLLDRMGNGIQSTPRDALVGDIAPKDIKGKCFGLRQSLSTAGSFAGGILGIIAMVYTATNYHYVFWLASIPAVLALAILIIAVKEPKKKFSKDVEIVIAKNEPRHPLHLSDLKRLGSPYWILMIVGFVFMCSRVGEASLIIHANKNYGFSENYAHLIMIIYNGANSLISYPIGRLSDRLDRRILLGIGFLVLIISDLLLSFSYSSYMMLFGVALWGVQIGITQSMFLALIVDYVPEDLRGTGFGFFYLITAVALILAGAIGGVAAEMFDERMTFMVSSFIGMMSLCVLYCSNKCIKFSKK